MAKVVLKFETNDSNGKKLEIDDGSIVALNSLSQSSSDGSSINYGCIANTGSIDVVDFNQNIAKMIKDGTMSSSNIDVDLYVNNNKIQSHITTDSTYDENTNEFNVSVTNRIADWDILKYKGYVYQNKSATLYEILADVFSVVSDSLDDALSEIITYTYPQDGSYTSKQGTVKEYLQLISIEYPSIEYGYTIRQIIDDICTIAQLQCFIDDNDKIKFVSARPIVTEESVPMIVDNSIIIGDVDSDLFIRNKYDGVELSEQSVEDVIDYNTVVFNDKITTSNKSLSSNIKTDNNATTGVLSSVNVNYVIGSYIKSSYKYYSTTIKVDKKQNNNLTQLLLLKDWSERDTLPFSVQYKKSEAYASASMYWQKNNNNVSLETDISTGAFGNEEFITEEGFVQDINNFTYTVTDGTITYDKVVTTQTSPDYPTASVKEYDNYYEISFKIPVAKNIAKLGGYSRYGNTSTGTSLDGYGTYYKYEAVALNISFYGNKRTISFNEISANSENIDLSKTKVSLNLSSKILQTKTFINESKISDIIKHNILMDYKNGLQSAKLQVVCYDMYDENGELVKNWQLGKILENNNIVQLGKKVMRINSRDFVYDGSPEIKLQALEQKLIFFYGLFKDGDGVYSWKHLVDSGKIQIIELSNGNIAILAGTDTSLDGDLILPLNVTELEGSFQNCSLLTNIILPESLKTISNYSFAGCTSLEKIKIPSSVTTIWSGAFANCDSLKEVIIPDTVLRMSGTVFTGCLSLEKVILPSTMTSIYTSGMFNNCVSLQYVRLPDNITSIASGSFQFCTSLKHIFIPKSVIEIQAFLTSGAYDSPFASSPNVVIYCEASSAQSGWEEGWNTYERILNDNDEYVYSYLTVKYGYTRAEYEAEVGLS